MISNNNFAKDRVSERHARLSKLSNSIGEHASGYEISAELLNWAENAETLFHAADIALMSKQLDLNQTKYELADSDNKLFKCYQVCKTILNSRFRGDEKISQLGIAGITPKIHTDLVSAAEILLRAVADMQSEGLTDILPEQFRMPLEEILAESAENIYKIGVMQEKFATEKRIFQEHFDRDTKKLRILYALFISFFDRNAPELTVLGFAINNKKRGRKKSIKEVAEG